MIKGAALFQCYPYSILYYSEFWDTETGTSLKNLAVPRITAAAAADEIDSTDNLQNRSIYIYSGL